MKVLARISVTFALVALVASITGPAAAGPSRKFTADFRNSSGTVIIPCVLTGATNTIAFRVTKVNKGGQPVRSADTTTSGFSSIAAGTPTSNSGSWSSSSTASGFSFDGHQLIKGNTWVQAPITATAPSTAGMFTWTTTADGPGKPTYTISGTEPVIHVVTDFANCPPGTTPIPDPDPDPDPPVTPQSTCAGRTTTIAGGAGDSLIIGTPGNDVIFDLAGHNHIEGRGGNDVICTGPGNDVILTLGGSDVIEDQGGQNLIRTDGGADSITTGRGNSRIAAGTGADTVSAGTGRNNIRLGKGRDRSVSSSGNDVVKGAGGKDRIIAGDGNNRLGGGRGNDRLRAGSGNDRLNGGRGRDTCRADGGRNRFRRCEVARGNGA